MSTAIATETKPQSKLPTSMRYERVQEILESQPAIRDKLSPKAHPIETRFGEKVYFSKETVEITEALHGEGKDAHKVPLNEVLRMAARVMMRLGSPGPNNSSSATAPAGPVAAPVQSEAPKEKPKKVKAAKPAAPEPPPPPPVPPKKKPEPPPPPKKVKAVAPVKPVKPVAPTEPAPAAEPAPAVKAEEPAMPESELPPERQPLRLPPEFDYSKYPHYSVQSSIYSLLLSALNMSEHYEKFPNSEARQKKLEDIVRDYQDTCDPLKFKS